MAPKGGLKRMGESSRRTRQQECAMRIAGVGGSNRREVGLGLPEFPQHMKKSALKAKRRLEMGSRNFPEMGGFRLLVVTLATNVAVLTCQVHKLAMITVSN
jgi:hypothetical protein